MGQVVPPSALAGFDPLVRDWFTQRFAAATEPQILGWPRIRAGHDILISAPTGSGKTLAAFLLCLDRLVRAARLGPLPNQTEVVYVSPLKALSNDIHINLEVPLSEIAAAAAAQGIPLAPIRAAVRTGDTPAWERTCWSPLPNRCSSCLPPSGPAICCAPPAPLSWTMHWSRPRAAPSRSASARRRLSNRAQSHFQQRARGLVRQKLRQ